jgi:hypothetical protein
LQVANANHEHFERLYYLKCDELEATQNHAEPAAPLGALAKRAIFDAIRGAYDLGYNDARNAKAVPGDNAPGYDGRNVEADHGGALLHRLNQLLKAEPAAQEPFGYFRPEPFGWTDCAKDDEGAIALYERPQEVGLTDEAVNDAAKVLAERFDYPWAHMPEEGRKNMRVQARAVVEAALRAKGASCERRI